MGVSSGSIGWRAGRSLRPNAGRTNIVPESTVSAPAIDMNFVTTRVTSLVENMERVFFGKHDVILQCVVGLLARGHLLIEDIPGIGKTTLAQALARSVDCTFNRIQFTSDMLPSDILGVSVLNPRTSDFEFRAGPIFANVVLADEVNRTPPKTQSALLEAMSEFHVSADGKTRKLPKPFIVLATQNPIEYEGTYTLPEAQLDRFLLRIEIGYPGEDDEIRIMRRHDSFEVLERLRPVLSAQDVIALQELAVQVHVDESVARYMRAIIQATREHPSIRLGASPRGALALFEACQAYAIVDGRDFVTPGDVKTMCTAVLSHRILVRAQGGHRLTSPRERALIIEDIISSVRLPV
jgi:MoxR-like ATPase